MSRPKTIIARCALFAIGLVLTVPSVATAQNTDDVPLTLQHHQFIPEKISVLPNKRFVIVLENKDNHPEEFESYDLEFEILVLPHKTIRVPVRPLPKGTYAFFGDFHPKTAKGVVSVGAPTP
jgi:hypothetical protein